MIQTTNAIVFSSSKQFMAAPIRMDVILIRLPIVISTMIYALTLFAMKKLAMEMFMPMILLILAIAS